MDAEGDEGQAVKIRLRDKDVARDDVELWLVRMPKDFDEELLQTEKLRLGGQDDPGTVLKVLEKGGKNGNKELYDLRVGWAAECEGLRAVVTSKKHNGLRLAKPFARQLTVVRYIGEVQSDQRQQEEVEGTGAESGPSRGGDKQQAKPPLVVPYAPVKQLEGMTVRFRPAGTGTELPEELQMEDSRAKNAKLKRRASTGGDAVVVKKESKAERIDVLPSPSKGGNSNGVSGLEGREERGGKKKVRRKERGDDGQKRRKSL